MNREIKFRKVKCELDIRSDPRIDYFIRNYDGYGKHMVSCKTGWNFEGERTIDIGSMKEICDSINEKLENNEENGYRG